MAYYTQVLQSDEQVLIVGRLHWVIYCRAALLIIAGLLAVVGSAGVQHSGLQIILQIGGCTILLIGLLDLLMDVVRKNTTEIVVTDRRVIYKRGIISRHTIEMNVSKIETVDVLQGLWARILGYGTVIIHGTGSGFEPLSRVADPLTIRNAIVAG
jgi:uncharacterized membrane protein YdbT with pleckstrin-like domain